MKLLAAILKELFSLFVDDGALALISAVLVAAVTGAVKLLALPPLVGGLVLLFGSIAILAESVHRGAQRQNRRAAQSPADTDTGKTAQTSRRPDGKQLWRLLDR
jgi:hypothetical protein